MIEPGRLTSLGEEADLRDAAAVLALAKACLPIRRAGRKADSTNAVNQALWSLWERARIPKPLIGRYPRTYPWSPAARLVVESNLYKRPEGGWGLVYEHVRPRGLLAGGIIELSENLDVHSLIELLNRHLAGAIITKAEDQQLTNAKVASAFIDPEDPSVWSRYTAAGIDPQTFAPLDEPFKERS